VTFANHYAIPAIYELREFVEVGGLIISGPPDRCYPVTLKCSQMADYLPPMAPVSTNTLSWPEESDYALASYRAFLRHAENPLRMINGYLGMVFGRPADQTAQRISLTVFQER
jgi:hypothetical protein